MWGALAEANASWCEHFLGLREIIAENKLTFYIPAWKINPKVVRKYKNWTLIWYNNTNIFVKHQKEIAVLDKQD